jgi:hypothetical protein
VTDRFGEAYAPVYYGLRERHVHHDQTTNHRGLEISTWRKTRCGGRFAKEQGQVERSRRISSANITTGFVLTTSADPGFSTYIEANAHADEVWTVFEALASRLLPEVAAPLVGWKDDEATLGPYTDKAAALAVLRAHAESLQHDGFIEFGLMFQQGGTTEEVMVKGSKDLRIWTNNLAVATETLSSLGIPRVEKLQFIDEYPTVTERLVGDPSSQETISAIVGAFQALPPK